MDNAALFRVDVRPRCFHRSDRPSSAACGLPAAVLRSNGSGVPLGYFCELHRQAGDEPIPESYVVPRVTLTAEIVFSGTSWRGLEARLEALERVHQAIESAGGVFSLAGLSCQVGRYEPPVRPGRKPAGLAKR